MCGPNLPRPSLGGALAVLSAPSSATTSTSRSAPALCGGSLVFHNPETETGIGGPATVATHATFTPPQPADADMDTGADELDLADYVVGIHASGDLLQPAFQSPILHRFGFRGGLKSNRLATPLEIGVGGDGIIGRRVTVWRSSSGSSSSSSIADGGGGGGFPVAEGIVGYN